MEYNVLMTGASGYLGGTVLNRLKFVELPPHKLYAVVRNEGQVESVKQYGAIPLQMDIFNEEQVDEAVSKYKINVIFSLHDAIHSTSQMYLIRALAKFRELDSKDVHFLHTSGAKLFSSHTGAPEHTVHDDDTDMYRIQKSQTSPFPVLQEAVDTNNSVIEECERLGVRSYIFFPCMVYGRGEGFGNIVSIQTTAIVKAARAAGKVYIMDKTETSWPVCHVVDTARLYVDLLVAILKGELPDHGKQGYYLAASGFAAWRDVYSRIAIAMHERGLIETQSLETVNPTALAAMAKALASPQSMVAPQISGNCSLVARHGLKLGWKPSFAADHILESLDTEVELILQHI